jgi:hypothetical protein
VPAALPQALIGLAISGLKGVTKFSCLDGFARQGTLFDKVSEDIQDRGIAWSHQNRAFLSGVSNPAKCACKAGASVAVTGFQWHLPLCAV